MIQYIYYNYEKSNVCTVHESKTEYTKATSLNAYLNKLCLENGATLKGRKESYRQLMESRKFSSVFIHKDLCLVPFPDGKWINHCAIAEVRYDKEFCYIFFKDGSMLKTKHIHRMKTSLTSTYLYLKMVNAK